MENGFKYCLICGKEMATGAGIDRHIRNVHKLDYEFYCQYFAEAEGEYSIYEEGRKGRVILTIT